LEEITVVKDKALADICEKIAQVERLNTEVAELKQAKVCLLLKETLISA
jgi:hypothetical protein